MLEPTAFILPKNTRKHLGLKVDKLIILTDHLTVLRLRRSLLLNLINFVNLLILTF